MQSVEARFCFRSFLGLTLLDINCEGIGLEGVSVRAHGRERLELSVQALHSCLLLWSIINRDELVQRINVEVLFQEDAQAVILQHLIIHIL